MEFRLEDTFDADARAKAGKDELTGLRRFTIEDAVGAAREVAVHENE